MSFEAEKILSLASKFEKNATGGLTKEASANDFHTVLRNYEENSEAVKDFVQALQSIANDFKANTDMSDPVQARIFELLNKQAEFVANCIPDVEYLDSEINELANGGGDTEEANDFVHTASKKTKKAYLQKFDVLIAKFGQEVSDSGSAPVYWNTKEQDESSVPAFLQPGGEKKVPGAPGMLYRPDVAVAQRKLNDMISRGKLNGKLLDPDGKLGPLTKAVLKAYKDSLRLPSFTDEQMIKALNTDAEPAQPAGPSVKEQYDSGTLKTQNEPLAGGRDETVIT